MAAKVVLLLCIALVCLAHSANGLGFDLQGSMSKCFHEDVDKDQLVVGDYSISHTDMMDVELVISDSRGHHVYKNEQATQGKFAFTSDDYDVFQICFKPSLRPHAPAKLVAEVNLNLKVGVEARSYDELARVEKLQPIEANLRRLEDLSAAIVKSFSLMKLREREHRDTNELTADRMLHFSILSILCVIIFAVWQAWYLRRYFQKKKLI